VIVADTNLVSYLLIDGDHTDLARRVYERDPNWRLPTLWRSEFLNVLATTVRTKVLSHEQALAAWHAALRLFGGNEHDVGGELVLAAALRHNISAYDAQFLVLANTLKVPLVTGDKALVRAATPVAQALGEFGSGGGR